MRDSSPMSEPSPPRKQAEAILQRIRRLFPGVILCLTVVAAARFLSDHYGAPQMLFALLLGMAFHFLVEEPSCAPGIELSARTVLRIGVALLGMRITIDEVMALGGFSVLWIGIGVILTIFVGGVAARAFGRRFDFGVLTGGAVGICGAAAALAISSILPRHPASERDTIFTVLAVTTLSTIAMVAYPILALGLGLDTLDSGIFLGATIHDVAQVVGAGYGMSAETGDISTITKLFRVMMLVPVVFVLSLAFRRRGGQQGKTPLPVFVLVFCMFVGFNSFGLIPEQLRLLLVNASSWCLVTAIAALGVKTSLKSLVDVGFVPVALMVAETLFIAGWVLAGLMIVF